MTNEQGNFNTFWACKMHRTHGSWRCAICDQNKLIELQAKVEELDNFIELVEDALGCTDGDDIRAHIEPELAALKQEGAK